MTEQIRLRIDRNLAAEASDVCREIGITPTAAVSMFFAQMVKLRGLPFRPSDFPALDEYEVTLAQATVAEDAALAEIASSRRVGRLEPFTGTL
ncbi:MAG: type II toxin-antitoxin system RelB/DinJ family antitoxin [Terrimicrobiaceae bacterium]